MSLRGSVVKSPIGATTFIAHKSSKIKRGASPGNQDDNQCCRRYAALFYFVTKAINVVAPMGLLTPDSHALFYFCRLALAR